MDLNGSSSQLTPPHSTIKFYICTSSVWLPVSTIWVFCPFCDYAGTEPTCQMGRHAHSVLCSQSLSSWAMVVWISHQMVSGNPMEQIPCFSLLYHQGCWLHRVAAVPAWTFTGENYLFALGYQAMANLLPESRYKSPRLVIFLLSK